MKTFSASAFPPPTAQSRRGGANNEPEGTRTDAAASWSAAVLRRFSSVTRPAQNLSFSEGTPARTRTVASFNSSERAFTLVEIALCLGIVAFALVAIMGVLPMGLKVQKENREDTIIDQEALYLIEAIRSGSRGLRDLTNHVEQITVRRGAQRTTYLVQAQRLSPEKVVALLSTPRYEAVNAQQLRTNQVTALVRPLTGVAAEQSPNLREVAFRYQAEIEIVPFLHGPPAVTEEELREAASLRWNLHEVRLTIRWPVYDRGGTWAVGNNRRVYRTTISGRLRLDDDGGIRGYLFVPGTFTSRM